MAPTPPPVSIFSRLLLTCLISLALTGCLEEIDDRNLGTNSPADTSQHQDTDIEPDTAIAPDTDISQDTDELPVKTCSPQCADNENCIDNQCVKSPLLALGSDHTCALSPDNNVYCWGANNLAQLGQGNTNSTANPTPLPVTIDSTDTISGIYASALQTCVTTTRSTTSEIIDNTWCWGNHYALSAEDKFENPAETPVLLEEVYYVGHPIMQLAFGSAHGCALHETGTVRCWGASAFGELGEGFSDYFGSPTPIKIRSLPPAIQITAGNDFTCALAHEDSRVYCWGAPILSSPDPITGEIPVSKTPLQIENLDNVFAIQAGAQHVCAILNDDEKSIKCWGSNSDGQLGTDSVFPSTKPTPPKNNISNVKQLALGTGYTCVLFYSGEVACTGSNISGQLGRGAAHTKNRYETFEIIPNFKNVHRITGYATHICAVHDNNEISCWGSNGKGQIGVNNPTKVFSPTKVSF